MRRLRSLIVVYSSVQSNDMPEAAEQLLERRLVDGRQLVAQLDEVGPRDRDLAVVLRDVAAVRRREVGVERLRRVAAHAVVVLHAALGGQAVVVPADRVEDRLAGHPLVAGEGVGLGVAEDGAHVDRAGHGRRRRVDREHRRPRRRCGRSGRRRRPPSARPSAPRCRRASACRGSRASVQDTDAAAVPGDARHPRTTRERRTVALDVVLRLYDTATREVRELAMREPGQGVDLPVRPHGLRPAAPRPRPGHAGVRRARPLPALDGPRRPPGVERHRHRRPHHRPRRARAAAVAGHHDEVRAGVVRGDGRHRRRPARRHPPRHRVRRRDGRR